MAHETPERICFHPSALEKMHGYIYKAEDKEPGDIEYVRADLAAPDAALTECEIEELEERLEDGSPIFKQRVLAAVRTVNADAVRQARRDEVLGENLRGTLYQTILGWIEAHSYLKSKLEQGDVGDLTARLAAALRAEGEKESKT